MPPQMPPQNFNFLIDLHVKMPPQMPPHAEQAGPISKFPTFFGSLHIHEPPFCIDSALRKSLLHKYSRKVFPDWIFCREFQADFTGINTGVKNHCSISCLSSNVRHTKFLRLLHFVYTSGYLFTFWCLDF